MAKKSKLNLINDDLTWNADRRYKVNSVVQLNGEDYQNITGKNSNPELLIDWQKIYTDISISEITDFPTFKTIENQSIIGAGNIDLDKNSVGLGNVDNTSDLLKPISTATQIALNTKEPAIASGTISQYWRGDKTWQEFPTIQTIDNIPTDGSNNAVSSNGVFDALATKAPISSVHNPVTLGTANGLSLSTQQLSLGLASSGVTGALSGTDWNTFNNKQPAITGLTTNYLPKWNGSGLGNSQFFDDGTNIGIGTTTPNVKFDVAGVIRSSFIDSYPSIEAFNQGTVGFPLFQLRNIKNSVEKFWNIENGRTVNGDLGFYNEGGQRITITTNGRILINKTDDDLINQLQVAGTISASPATTANQVVVKSQLDAVARPYKVYTALLSQTGTNAPTASVLENTLGGTVVWSYISNGIYKATLASVFVLDKTISFITFGNVDNPSLNTADVSYTNNNEVTLITRLNGTPTNSIMDGRTAFEIRAYK